MSHKIKVLNEDGTIDWVDAPDSEDTQQVAKAGSENKEAQVEANTSPSASTPPPAYTPEPTYTPPAMLGGYTPQPDYLPLPEPQAPGLNFLGKVENDEAPPQSNDVPEDSTLQFLGPVQDSQEETPPAPEVTPPTPEEKPAAPDNLPLPPTIDESPQLQAMDYSQYKSQQYPAPQDGSVQGEEEHPHEFQQRIASYIQKISDQAGKQVEAGKVPNLPESPNQQNIVYFPSLGRTYINPTEDLYSLEKNLSQLKGSQVDLMSLSLTDAETKLQDNLKTIADAESWWNDNQELIQTQTKLLPPREMQDENQKNLQAFLDQMGTIQKQKADQTSQLEAIQKQKSDVDSLRKLSLYQPTDSDLKFTQENEIAPAMAHVDGGLREALKRSGPNSWLSGTRDENRKVFLAQIVDTLQKDPKFSSPVVDAVKETYGITDDEIKALIHPEIAQFLGQIGFGSQIAARIQGIDPTFLQSQIIQQHLNSAEAVVKDVRLAVPEVAGMAPKDLQQMIEDVTRQTPADREYAISQAKKLGDIDSLTPAMKDVYLTSKVAAYINQNGGAGDIGSLNTQNRLNPLLGVAIAPLQAVADVISVPGLLTNIPQIEGLVELGISGGSKLMEKLQWLDKEAETLAVGGYMALDWGIGNTPGLSFLAGPHAGEFAAAMSARDSESQRQIAREIGYSMSWNYTKNGVGGENYQKLLTDLKDSSLSPEEVIRRWQNPVAEGVGQLVTGTIIDPFKAIGSMVAVPFRGFQALDRFSVARVAAQYGDDAAASIRLAEYEGRWGEGIRLGRVSTPEEIDAIYTNQSKLERATYGGIRPEVERMVSIPGVHAMPSRPFLSQTDVAKWKSLATTVPEGLDLTGLANVSNRFRGGNGNLQTLSRIAAQEISLTKTPVEAVSEYTRPSYHFAGTIRPHAQSDAIEVQNWITSQIRHGGNAQTHIAESLVSPLARKLEAKHVPEMFEEASRVQSRIDDIRRTMTGVDATSRVHLQNEANDLATAFAHSYGLTTAGKRITPQTQKYLRLMADGWNAENKAPKEAEIIDRLRLGIRKVGTSPAEATFKGLMEHPAHYANEASALAGRMIERGVLEGAGARNGLFGRGLRAAPSLPTIQRGRLLSSEAVHYLEMKDRLVRDGKDINAIVSPAMASRIQDVAKAHNLSDSGTTAEVLGRLEGLAGKSRWNPLTYTPKVGLKQYWTPAGSLMDPEKLTASETLQSAISKTLSFHYLNLPRFAIRNALNNIFTTALDGWSPNPHLDMFYNPGGLSTEQRSLLKGKNLRDVYREMGLDESFITGGRGLENQDVLFRNQARWARENVARNAYVSDESFGSMPSYKRNVAQKIWDNKSPRAWSRKFEEMASMNIARQGHTEAFALLNEPTLTKMTRDVSKLPNVSPEIKAYLQAELSSPDPSAGLKLLSRLKEGRVQLTSDTAYLGDTAKMGSQPFRNEVNKLLMGETRPDVTTIEKTLERTYRGRLRQMDDILEEAGFKEGLTTNHPLAFRERYQQLQKEGKLSDLEALQETAKEYADALDHGLREQEVPKNVIRHLDDTRPDALASHPMIEMAAENIQNGKDPHVELAKLGMEPHAADRTISRITNGEDAETVIQEVGNGIKSTYTPTPMYPIAQAYAEGRGDVFSLIGSGIPYQESLDIDRRIKLMTDKSPEAIDKLIDLWNPYSPLKKVDNTVHAVTEEGKITPVAITPKALPPVLSHPAVEELADEPMRGVVRQIADEQMTRPVTAEEVRRKHIVQSLRDEGWVTNGDGEAFRVVGYNNAKVVTEDGEPIPYSEIVAIHDGSQMVYHRPNPVPRSSGGLPPSRDAQYHAMSKAMPEWDQIDSFRKMPEMQEYRKWASGPTFDSRKYFLSKTTPDDLQKIRQAVDAFGGDGSKVNAYVAYNLLRDMKSEEIDSFKNRKLLGMGLGLSGGATPEQDEEGHWHYGEYDPVKGLLGGALGFGVGAVFSRPKGMPSIVQFSEKIDQGSKLRYHFPILNNLESRSRQYHGIVNFDQKYLPHLLEKVPDFETRFRPLNDPALWPKELGVNWMEAKYLRDSGIVKNFKIPRQEDTILASGKRIKNDMFSFDAVDDEALQKAMWDSYHKSSYIEGYAVPKEQEALYRNAGVMGRVQFKPEIENDGNLAALEAANRQVEKELSQNFGLPSRRTESVMPLKEGETSPLPLPEKDRYDYSLSTLYDKATEGSEDRTRVELLGSKERGFSLLGPGSPAEEYDPYLLDTHTSSLLNYHHVSPYAEPHDVRQTLAAISNRSPHLSLVEQMSEQLRVGLEAREASMNWIGMMDDFHNVDHQAMLDHRVAAFERKTAGIDPKTLTELVDVDTGRHLSVEDVTHQFREMMTASSGGSWRTAADTNATRANNLIAQTLHDVNQYRTAKGLDAVSLGDNLDPTKLQQGLVNAMKEAGYDLKTSAPFTPSGTAVSTRPLLRRIGDKEWNAGYSNGEGGLRVLNQEIPKNEMMPHLVLPVPGDEVEFPRKLQRFMGKDARVELKVSDDGKTIIKDADGVGIHIYPKDPQMMEILSQEIDQWVDRNFPHPSDWKTKITNQEFKESDLRTNREGMSGSIVDARSEQAKDRFYAPFQMGNRQSVVQYGWPSMSEAEQKKLLEKAQSTISTASDAVPGRVEVETKGFGVTHTLNNPWVYDYIAVPGGDVTHTLLAANIPDEEVRVGFPGFKIENNKRVNINTRQNRELQQIWGPYHLDNPLRLDALREESGMEPGLYRVNKEDKSLEKVELDPSKVSGNQAPRSYTGVEQLGNRNVPVEGAGDYRWTPSENRMIDPKTGREVGVTGGKAEMPTPAIGTSSGPPSPAVRPPVSTAAEIPSRQFLARKMNLHPDDPRVVSQWAGMIMENPKVQYSTIEGARQTLHDILEGNNEGDAVALSSHIFSTLRDEAKKAGYSDEWIDQHTVAEVRDAIGIAAGQFHPDTSQRVRGIASTQFHKLSLADSQAKLDQYRQAIAIGKNREATILEKEGIPLLSERSVVPEAKPSLRPTINTAETPGVLPMTGPGDTPMGPDELPQSLRPRRSIDTVADAGDQRSQVAEGARIHLENQVGSQEDVSSYLNGHTPFGLIHGPIPSTGQGHTVATLLGDRIYLDSLLEAIKSHPVHDLEIPESTRQGLIDKLSPLVAKHSESVFQNHLDSMRVGKRMADYALHNYSNVNDLDTILRWMIPWHFWTTRTALKYGERLLDKPEVFSRTFRLFGMQDAISPKDDSLPEKIQNKLRGRLHFPLVDTAMGNFYDIPGAKASLDARKLMFPMDMAGFGDNPNPKSDLYAASRDNLSAVGKGLLLLQSYTGGLNPVVDYILRNETLPGIGNKLSPYTADYRQYLKDRGQDSFGLPLLDTFNRIVLQNLPDSVTGKVIPNPFGISSWDRVPARDFRSAEQVLLGQMQSGAISVDDFRNALYDLKSVQESSSIWGGRLGYDQGKVHVGTVAQSALDKARKINMSSFDGMGALTGISPSMILPGDITQSGMDPVERRRELFRQYGKEVGDHFIYNIDGIVIDTDEKGNPITAKMAPDQLRKLLFNKEMSGVNDSPWTPAANDLVKAAEMRDQKLGGGFDAMSKLHSSDAFNKMIAGYMVGDSLPKMKQALAINEYFAKTSQYRSENLDTPLESVPGLYGDDYAKKALLKKGFYDQWDGKKKEIWDEVRQKYGVEPQVWNLASKNLVDSWGEFYGMKIQTALNPELYKDQDGVIAFPYRSSMKARLLDMMVPEAARKETEDWLTRNSTVDDTARDWIEKYLEPQLRLRSDAFSLDGEDRKNALASAQKDFKYPTVQEVIDGIRESKPELTQQYIYWSLRHGTASSKELAVRDLEDNPDHFAEFLKAEVGGMEQFGFANDYLAAQHEGKIQQLRNGTLDRFRLPNGVVVDSGKAWTDINGTAHTPKRNLDEYLLADSLHTEYVTKLDKTDGNKDLINTLAATYRTPEYEKYFGAGPVAAEVLRRMNVLRDDVDKGYTALKEKRFNDVPAGWADKAGEIQRLQESLDALRSPYKYLATLATHSSVKVDGVPAEKNTDLAAPGGVNLGTAKNPDRPELQSLGDYIAGTWHLNVNSNEGTVKPIKAPTQPEDGKARVSETKGTSPAKRPAFTSITPRQSRGTSSGGTRTSSSGRTSSSSNGYTYTDTAGNVRHTPSSVAHDPGDAVKGLLATSRQGDLYDNFDHVKDFVSELYGFPVPHYAVGEGKTPQEIRSVRDARFPQEWPDIQSFLSLAEHDWPTADSVKNEDLRHSMQRGIIRNLVNHIRMKEGSSPLSDSFQISSGPLGTQDIPSLQTYLSHSFVEKNPDFRAVREMVMNKYGYPDMGNFRSHSSLPLEDRQFFSAETWRRFAFAKPEIAGLLVAAEKRWGNEDHNSLALLLLNAIGKREGWNPIDTLSGTPAPRNSYLNRSGGYAATSPAVSQSDHLQDYSRGRITYNQLLNSLYGVPLPRPSSQYQSRTQSPAMQVINRVPIRPKTSRQKYSVFRNV